MSAVRASASTVAGRGRRRALLAPRVGGAAAGWAAAVGAGALAALSIAADAGVSGPAALPGVVRALAATLLVFGLFGYPLAERFAPEALARERLLLVLPLGAVASGLALTLLGFAGVPFAVSLPLSLAGAAVACVAARRGAAPRPGLERRALLGLAAISALIVALALVPTFRSGMLTVTGTGADAHQVAGSAELLRQEHPVALEPELPVDRVRQEWRSKHPIFYPLAAVASVSGLETYEALMTVAAVVLAATGLAFFLLARRLFGAGLAVAAAALVVALLDRQVFHVGLHPYYNQLWGTLTLPLTLVLGHVWLEDRSRRTLALLAAVTLMGAFAYPLMLPFSGLSLAGMWLLDRRERRRRGERPATLRSLWRGPRSLLWMVPAGLLLLVPILGVVEKSADFARLLLDLGDSLDDWRGDLFAYPPFGEFFGVPDAAPPVAAALSVAVIALAAVGLRLAPRRVGPALAAVFGAALLSAGFFRAVPSGEYVYFKILAFAGPVLLVAAVAALGALVHRRGRAPRAAGAAGLAALVVFAVGGARAEISETFDQLTPQMQELSEWSAALPAGASIRLDTLPREQLWHAYMLSEHPLGSRRPNVFFPHVAYSESADYALADTGPIPPGDAAGEPVFRNEEVALYRLRPSAGADTTSRRQASYLNRLRAGDPRLRRLIPVVPDPTR